MKRLYLLACLITVISLLTGCENEQDRARAVENLAKAQAFLNENGQKQGVKTTASGLQYEISREGDGPRPDQRRRPHEHRTRDAEGLQQRVRGDERDVTPGAELHQGALELCRLREALQDAELVAHDEQEHHRQHGGDLGLLRRAIPERQR